MTGLSIEVVGDDLDVVGRAVRARGWRRCCSLAGACEAPADDVAGVVEVAHERDAAETRALQFAVVEVDAVDPEAALAVDELAVGGGLDLRARRPCSR